MKIGLVCNYYIHNYGSLLQCYATQRAIHDMGYDIEAIQFENIPTKKAKIQHYVRLKSIQLLKPKAVLKKLKNIKNANYNDEYNNIRTIRNQKFDQFISQNLILSKPYKCLNEISKECEKYDLIMLGSDQLLCPKDIIFGYHTLSFVPDNIKKIAYAASFGLSKLPITVRRKAKKELNRFDCFSAREKEGAKIYNSLTGKEVPVVVDPTLLIKANEWRNIAGKEAIIKEKYIYCHFLGNNPSHRKWAEKLKENTGYKIVTIRHAAVYIKSDNSFGDIAVNTAGPEEFINLIANAEYVLADSFHATIFSIMFHKKFVVFNRFKEGSSGSTNSRLESLLSQLELQYRRVESDSDMLLIWNNDIDYRKIDDILNDWIKQSKEYLKKVIEA